MRALIIEDDPYIAEALKQALVNERLVVETAPDGDSGAFFAKTNDYDIILLDTMLPKKGGAEVCRDIREHGKTSAILSISAKDDSATKVSLLDAGVDDYLGKPFSMDEVVARVRALLRRPHQMVGDCLSFDDIVVNTREQTATRAGRELSLTRKEFMLLEYFMRNIGTVLSRAMLIEHVWDMELDPFSNTIEAHVMSLRKKLAAHNRQKVIHTIMGRGYKMAVA
ncbi:MAG TPA: response regulator transcription factor [Candidatus Paceibacterota bacterium]|nr:response regulator transcription factor [Candidatus Paceibacterota bacterium]